MKKFKFRLQRVLQYREVVKQEKLRVLSERNHALQQSEAKLAELENAASQSWLPEDGVTTAEAVMMSGMFNGRLKDEIINQQLRIMQDREAVEEARLDYIESTKEVKTLSTLKDRKRVEYGEYVAKEEEKALDEFVTQRGNELQK